MIVIMRMGADAHEIGGVLQRIKDLGFKPHVSSGSERVIVGIIGNDRPLDAENFISLQGVERVVPILAPYKLASRDFNPTDTVIRVNDALIGGKNVAIMAGPCSVESREQTFEIARQLRDMGVKSCGAGHTSRALLPIASRGSEKRGCKFWQTCASNSACRS